MKNIHQFLPLLFVLCAFCKKDNTSQVEQILVNGTWYLEAYLTDDDEDGTFEDVTFPCQLGDGFKFAPNHAFELRDEIEYCDSDVDTVAVIPGVWALQNNNTVIDVNVGDGFLRFEFHIHTINDTLLELRTYLEPLTQTPQEERFVLKR